MKLDWHTTRTLHNVELSRRCVFSNTTKLSVSRMTSFCVREKTAHETEPNSDRHAQARITVTVRWQFQGRDPSNHLLTQ